MTFIYEMCPYCMEQLIERKQSIESQNNTNFCPKCGKKLALACYGEQKLDNTVYKIILNDALISDCENKKNNFLHVIMKVGNCSFDEALEKYNTSGCVVFEGDISGAYVSMGLLDDFTPDIHYTVIPSFPFERFLDPFISICPTCGNDTIHKVEDMRGASDYVKDGIFCERCHEWLMFTTMPKSNDEMENNYMEE